MALLLAKIAELKFPAVVVGIWILYVIVLFLNCLMAEGGEIAAKRNLIIDVLD